MEGVVEDAEARSIHAPGIGDRLVAGVEQMRLEAVERLQPGGDSGGERERHDLAVDLGASLKLGLARLLAGEHAERLEPRPGEHLTAERGAAIDDPAQMIDAGAADAMDRARSGCALHRG